jgi:hypothetical protein
MTAVRTLFYALLVTLIGCASSTSSSNSGGWIGPTRAAEVSVAPWTAHDAPGSVLSSAKYRVYTTLPEGPRRDGLPQVLEGAYAQYQQLGPVATPDDRPLHCFVFAQRAEWEEFTARKTGEDAPMYLKIPKGGYTIGDWFVAYSDSDEGYFSAAAHEGWHQYAARHFKGKLPPFLEEGVACLFENVQMVRGLPRWNTSVNPIRSQALTVAAKANRLWTLDELLRLDAGDVVEPPAERDAFYAQSWAFARFLLEAEGGRYRPMFRQLLADAAAGTTFEPDTTLTSPRRGWDPDVGRVVLEHYLQQDFASIDQAYHAFVTQITAGKERRRP